MAWFVTHLLGRAWGKWGLEIKRSESVNVKNDFSPESQILFYFPQITPRTQVRRYVYGVPAGVGTLRFVFSPATILPKTGV